MNNLTTFYIVRHGETEYNIKRIAQGHLDSPLTAKGIEDAEKLGYKFKDINFDLIFSSDLLRAKRTAEIIALERKLAVQTTEILRERSYGKFEGQPFETIHTYRMLLGKLKEKKSEENKKNQFEEDDSVTSRFITFLRETAITYPDKVILVVTHGGMMRMLMKHLGYDMPSGSVSNTGYMKLETDGVNFFVKQMEGIELANSA